ncbi:MAG: acyl-[acyl-carrier-protein]--UDP-N-acetylglucosamine O-acyltransferase, partial [Thermodesulfovibrionales bacterium]|nr:acyl-[acyl-carrier-protein]--UDP-N-acetylglucosamine O-acyltransferase [Thermodesulfovibrionales bacterium]
METGIHKTAIIDPKASIDEGVQIGPFCIVGEGARLKKGTRLISNVIIDGNTEIGENCTIHPFASIGLPPQDLKYKDEKTGVKIGNNNIIREYVTIHRASVGGDGITEIGSDNFL